MKDEKILIIKKKFLPKPWLQKKAALPIDASVLNHVLNGKVLWMNRKNAENNSDYKQLIPYLLIRHVEGSFAGYPRHGSESRLHGLWSAGIGGHISQKDNTANGNTHLIINHAIKREYAEEFVDPPVTEFKLLGIINEELSNVGLVHIGLVYMTEINSKPVADEEIKGMKWLFPAEFKNYNFELWSDLAFKLYDQSCF